MRRTHLINKHTTFFWTGRVLPAQASVHLGHRDFFNNEKHETPRKKLFFYASLCFFLKKRIGVVFSIIGLKLFASSHSNGI